MPSEPKKFNGIVFAFSSVPGPVSNLKFSFTNSTSLEITWEAPVETNGVIISYKVVVKVSTGVVLDMNVLSDQELSVPVANLGM